MPAISSLYDYVSEEPQKSISSRARSLFSKALNPAGIQPVNEFPSRYR